MSTKPVILGAPKVEKSSERMVSILRKEKTVEHDVITRYDNIRIEKPENDQTKRRDHLKMVINLFL